MASKGQLVFDADMGKVLREILNVANAMQKGEASARDLKNELGEVEKKGDTLFSGMESKVTKAASAGHLLEQAGRAILKVYEAITAELENQLNIQKDSLDLSRSFAGSMDTLISTLQAGGQSPEQIKEFLNFLKEVSKNTGVEQKFLIPAATGAFSASGSNINITREALLNTALSSPNRPELLKLEAEGAISLMQALPKGSTATGAAGFISQIGSRSRVVEPLQQVQNIPTAIVGMVENGFTPEEAAAAFVALSVKGTDREGRITGTGGIRLAQKLGRFFEEEPDFLSAKKRRDVTRGRAKDRFAARRRLRAGGFAGDIGGLQGALDLFDADPDLLQEFLNQTTFEAKVEGPIRSLLFGRSSTRQHFGRELDEFTLSNAQREGFFRKQTLGFRTSSANFLFPLTEESRRVNVAREQLKLDPVLAAGGVAQEALEAVPETGGLRSVLGLGTDFTSGLAQFEGRQNRTAQLVRNRQAILARRNFLVDREANRSRGFVGRTLGSIEAGINSFYDTFGEVGFDASTERRDAPGINEAAIPGVPELDRLIDAIDRLVEVTQETNRQRQRAINQGAMTGEIDG